MPELLKRERFARERPAREQYRPLVLHRRTTADQPPTTPTLDTAVSHLHMPFNVLPHMLPLRWHMVFVNDLLWAPPRIWLQATRPYWLYTGPRATQAVISALWWLEVCKNG